MWNNWKGCEKDAAYVNYRHSKKGAFYNLFLGKRRHAVAVIMKAGIFMKQRRQGETNFSVIGVKLTSHRLYSVLLLSTFCTVMSEVMGSNFRTPTIWSPPFVGQQGLATIKYDRCRVSGFYSVISFVPLYLALARLFVKVPRPRDSEVTISIFKSSCHLLLPV